MFILKFLLSLVGLGWVGELLDTKLGKAILAVILIVVAVIAGYLYVQHWENSIRTEARAAALIEFNTAQARQTEEDRKKFAEAQRKHQEEVDRIQKQLDAANATLQNRVEEAERAIDKPELEDRPLSPLLQRMLEELGKLQ